MADTQDSDAVTALKALRDQVRARLFQHPDYKALLVLEKAIAELEPVPAIVNAARIRERDRPITQTDAAFQVLTEVQQPLTTAELIPAIQNKGARVGGDDPIANLGSNLSRDERFVSIKWGVNNRCWWLAGVPTPVPIFSQTFLARPTGKTETAGSPQSQPAVPNGSSSERG